VSLDLLHPSAGPLMRGLILPRRLQDRLIGTFIIKEIWAGRSSVFAVWQVWRKTAASARNGRDAD
jgi:hypothetical protein